MSSVALLGAGTMGRPIARNLASAGFSVRVWNRSIERARPLAEQGIEVCESPQRAADGARLLITMLSDADAVVDSAGAAVDALAPDAVWAQLSTIGLQGTQLCIELAQRAGVGFVDAPVLGTREPAERGELVILAGASPEALEACESAFAAIGSRTLHVGEPGQGTAAKLVANHWTVSLTAVLAETLALAEELGVDPRVFLSAIEDGPLDVPYAHIKGELMIDRDFGDPSFKLALARKDAGLVLDAAGQRALDLSVLRAVSERLECAERSGHGEEDMAAVRSAVGADRELSGGRMHGGEL